jgi:hypothetical protein
LSSSDGGRLVTFRNIHAAISAERLIKSKGCDFDLVPVPRAISSDCGFCLFLSPREERGDVAESLKEIAGWPDFEGAYRVLEWELPGKARREKTYEREI